MSRLIGFSSSLLAILLLPIEALAEDSCLQYQSYFDWWLQTEHTQYRSNAMFPDTVSAKQERAAVLDMQLDYCDWRASLAFHHDWQSSLSNSTTASNPKVIFKELVWQSSLDTELPLDVTIGKTRLDWGLGYAYQPLDIFRPYQGQSLVPMKEQGTGVVAVSYFDAVGEWSLAFSEPSWANDSDVGAIQVAKKPTLGIRHYRLQGNDEFVGQVAYDKGRGLILGAGWTRVVGDAMQLYSSALWQQYYQAYVIPSALLMPVAAQKQSMGHQLMMGLTWTDALGQTVILEYAYDSRAWDNSQWESSFERLGQLSNLPGTKALQQSYGLGYKHKNIVRHNLMLHWSLAASTWSNWNRTKDWDWLQKMSPSVDLAYAPQDDGFIVTPKLTWKWDQDAERELEMGLFMRYFNGPSRSSYANLSIQRQMAVNLKGHF